MPCFFGIEAKSVDHGVDARRGRIAALVLEALEIASVLRQRNVGPILDACGWAVNGRMKINIPFGAALTCIAKVPPQALLPFKDPFAEKKTGRFWTWFLVTVALLWLAGIAIWTRIKANRHQAAEKQTTVIVTNTTAITVTNVTVAATNSADRQ